jgi:hypothetical protein
VSIFRIADGSALRGHCDNEDAGQPPTRRVKNSTRLPLNSLYMFIYILSKKYMLLYDFDITTDLNLIDINDINEE